MKLSAKHKLKISHAMKGRSTPSHNRKIEEIKPVISIDEYGEITPYESVSQAARENKVTKSTLSLHLHRKSKTCNGKVFFFAETK